MGVGSWAISTSAPAANGRRSAPSRTASTPTIWSSTKARCSSRWDRAGPRARRKTVRLYVRGKAFEFNGSEESGGYFYFGLGCPALDLPEETGRILRTKDRIEIVRWCRVFDLLFSSSRPLRLCEKPKRAIAYPGTYRMRIAQWHDPRGTPGDSRPHLLFVSHCVPNPPDKGEKIRAFHEVRFLARKYRIHPGLLRPQRCGTEVSARTLRRLHFHLCGAIPLHPRTRARGRALRLRDLSQPGVLRQPLDAALRRSAQPPGTVRGRGRVLRRDDALRPQRRADPARHDRRRLREVVALRARAASRISLRRRSAAPPALRNRLHRSRPLHALDDAE